MTSAIKHSLETEDENTAQNHTQFTFGSNMRHQATGHHPNLFINKVNNIFQIITSLYLILPLLSQVCLRCQAPAVTVSVQVQN